MTDDPALKVPRQRPENDHPRLYLLADRRFAGNTGQSNGHLRHDPRTPTTLDVFTDRTPADHRRTDTSNQGPVSGDLIGSNGDRPGVTGAQRERILQALPAHEQRVDRHMAASPAIHDR